MVDEETGRAVDTDNKGRGYKLSKGKYVEIEPDEIDAIEFENTHTIDIDKSSLKKISTSATTNVPTTSCPTASLARKRSRSSATL